jgi:hypothetical protein
MTAADPALSLKTLSRTGRAHAPVLHRAARAMGVVTGLAALEPDPCAPGAPRAPSSTSEPA